MKRISQYTLLGLAFWFLLFLGWEWWGSYPKVRLTPLSFPETANERIDSLIFQSLADYLIPGMAVGIILNEKVTYLNAFGFANLETKDSLTLQSMIPVASVSKMFTALTLANFALENELDIDTLANAILPPTHRLPEEYNHITLLDLLTHTSGIKDKRGLGTLLKKKDSTILRNLPKFLSLSDPLDQNFQYADANFDLIGYILQVKENRPFENIAKERTLQKVGMEKSEFVTNWPMENISNSGHQRTFLWKRIEEKALNLERFPSPSSGLVLTPEDLSMGLLHLSRASMGIFGDELVWLKGKTSTPAGFQMIRLQNKDFIGHYGGQGGFSSLVVYSPELDLAFFLLTNSQDHADFRKEIAEQLVKIVLN